MFSLVIQKYDSAMDHPFTAILVLLLTSSSLKTYPYCRFTQNLSLKSLCIVAERYISYIYSYIGTDLNNVDLYYPYACDYL